MSESWKNVIIAGGAILIVAGLFVFFNEPKESKDRLGLAIGKTEAAKSVTKAADTLGTFLLSLKARNCIIVGDHVFGAGKVDEVTECWLTNDNQTYPVKYKKDGKQL